MSPEDENVGSSETADRKPPRRSLARHLSELQLLLDQAPSFLALTQGREHVVAITNAAYLNLVGRPREDLVGKRIVEAVPELKEQGIEQLLDAVLDSGLQRTGAAVKIQFCDASTGAITERRVDFILQPIFDATSQTVGIFMQGLDVTDRELALEALRQADRNKDDFLAVLAHEMLNPLSASRVALQLLASTLTEAGPHTTRVLGLLQRQYEFLAALVEDLLDVSRIKLGKVSLTIEDVVLQEVVNTAIETARHRLDSGSHDLKVVAPPHAVTVRADRHRLVQVLTNLLINAAKFTPPRGTVSIELVQGSDEAQITVTDNGAGMTAEQAARAFDLFQQYSGQPAKGGGLGIGLALVRQLVELQGGAVRAHSPGPSQGTSITVSFPRAHQAASK
ncbi:PAS domain-containing sensor histidine kinase [Ramlibacter algicola]|uniref:histidine kinase n=1 Tax=Ramlibacter algicola TaxID=2795217 RepID=A0A934Q5B0_9BURK|nr:PAS domain-containing sensor histidine kinase [Ramlibacter algicola]MBK0394896.1 PAS domain-containing protein [Ramlibacter algicola]